MLTAILLCFVQCFLGTFCDFVSITVAEDVDLSNQTIGAIVEAHCETQRSKFGQGFVRPCSLYRWFYEPRRFELTCVCLAYYEMFANGTLLREIHQSIGIPAINLTRFAALYELQIWTLSDPVQTARGLFSGAATNAVSVLHAGCRPLSNEAYAYYCVIVHYNMDFVTWEYPENWSGPVRYLTNIAYNASETTVRVLGIYWPEELHVDTVLLVEANATEICERFLSSISDKLIMKCRVEFREETFGYKPFQLARVNLLMSADFVEPPTVEANVLNITTRLKPIGQSCRFPVNIREEIPSYVPADKIMNGDNFEFLVTFRRAALKKGRKITRSETARCNQLKKFSGELITSCKKVEINADYGFAEVLFLPTNTSVWEAQIRLMTKMNSSFKYRCNFNVAIKQIFKVY